MPPLDHIVTFQSGSRLKEWRGVGKEKSCFKSRIAGLLLGGMIIVNPQTLGKEETRIPTSIICENSGESLCGFYTKMIQDIFDEDIVLPENFPEISEKYIKPLHQVLIDVGMGDIFTGDDAANITALAIMRGDKGFLKQLRYLEESFPNPIINDKWREAIKRIFLTVDY